MGIRNRRIAVQQLVHHTVFIVDDDEAVRLSMRMLLCSFGWKCRAFSCGSECLDAVRKEAPDCLLLDLNMPEMTGPEVQQILARLNIDVPVVAMTGDPDSPLVKRSMAAGARDVLFKPFGDDLLQLALERSMLRVQ
jgi:FixJ family two-component response regulator